MATLRAECPWDRAQTHGSLMPHLLEESYEVLDALGELHAAEAAWRAATCWPRPAGHLEEELGDLLFQIVFHARLAQEAGRSTLADVARGVHDKLVHRHPHVFGDVDAATRRRGQGELGGDKEGGEGSLQRHRRHPGRSPRSAALHQVAEQGALRAGCRSPRPGEAGTDLAEQDRRARSAVRSTRRPGRADADPRRSRRGDRAARRRRALRGGGCGAPAGNRP